MVDQVYQECQTIRFIVTVLFNKSDYSPTCHLLIHDLVSFQTSTKYTNLQQQQILIVENNGKTPHLIISHLHRSMLDPNRPVEQAAQGNAEAIAAYEAFHGSIKHAHATLDGKPGLHIDFHGYTDVYRQNNTMIGYLFNSKDLNSGDTNIEKSSIRALIKRTGLPVQQFLFGEKSLGSLFESAGYKAVPSPRQPYPGKDKYYRGGWITQIHGSRDGGVIDAVQLEFPQEIRIEATDEERFKFGVKLAKNIEEFHSIYYS